MMDYQQLLAEITHYVNQNISIFHELRLANLGKVKINDLVRRKNPYLFRVKEMTLSHNIVKAFLDAHLSFSEETIFT